MSTGEFKVVFRGGILAGFDAETVREKAGRRLKASEEQIGKLFSGRLAILRKGVDQSVADRYVRELRAIGMDVSSETMTPAASAATAEPMPATSPAPAPSADLEKTQLADPNALAAYLNESMMPLHGDAPDSLIGRKQAPKVATPTAPAPAQDPVQTLVASAEALDRYVNAAAEFTPPPEASPPREAPALVAMAAPAEPGPVEPEVRPALSSPFSHMQAPQAEAEADDEAERQAMDKALARRKKQYFIAGALIVLLLVLWLI